MPGGNIKAILSVVIFLALISSAAAQLSIQHVKLTAPATTDEVKPGQWLDIDFDVDNPTKDDFRSTVAVIDFPRDNGGGLTDEEGDKVEFKRDLFTVRAYKTTPVSLKFRVPYTVHDQDNFTMHIVITTRSPANSSVMTVEDMGRGFTIDKLPHDLIFENMLVKPESTQCGDSVLLGVIIRNIGNANEIGKLDITNKELGIALHEQFRLSPDYDKNNTFSHSYVVPVPAAAKGAFDIAASLAFGSETRTDSVRLTVDCVAPVPLPEQMQPEPQQKQEVPAQEEPQRQEQPPQPSPPPEEQATPQLQPQKQAPYFPYLVAAEILLGIILLYLVWQWKKR